MKNNFTFFRPIADFVKYFFTLALTYISRSEYNACYFSVPGFFYAFYREIKRGTIPPCKLVMGLLLLECKSAGKVVPFFFYTTYNKFTRAVMTYTIKFVIRAKYALLTTQANAKFWQLSHFGHTPPTLPPLKQRIQRINTALCAFINPNHLALWI